MLDHPYSSPRIMSSLLCGHSDQPPPPPSPPTSHSPSPTYYTSTPCNSNGTALMLDHLFSLPCIMSSLHCACGHSDPTSPLPITLLLLITAMARPSCWTTHTASHVSWGNLHSCHSDQGPPTSCSHYCYSYCCYFFSFISCSYSYYHYFQHCSPLLRLLPILYSSTYTVCCRC